MYSAPELNISNDKKLLAQLGHCMGVLVPKIGSSCSRTHCLPCPASHQPSQITASCIFRPSNHVPASIDSFQTSVRQLTQIALFSSFPPPPLCPTLGDLLISSEQRQWGVERLMYGDQTLPDGQIWDFRRRVNGRSRILTNSVSQSLILG